jgi:hypothetical protein
VSRVAPLGPVDYGSVEVPSRYHCGECGTLGVKLWRAYQTFLDHQALRCARCACTEQNQEPVRIDDAGKMWVGSYRGDQIGWFVPAVPTEDGETYWGYTSVPDAGVAWWKRLPL